MKRITLDLIYRGLYLVIYRKVHNLARIKVANADRADATLFFKPTHRSPRAVGVAIWLMDEIQIEIIKP